MMHRSFKYFLVPAAFGMTLLCGGPARASLGGDAASALADADEMRGMARADLR